MKKFFLYAALTTGLVLTIGLTRHAAAQPAPTDLRLWYRQPAQIWTEALPIGNGDLGAMIFGGEGEEHLQLNVSTWWTGRPRSYQLPDAGEYLDTIRQLLFAGKQADAEALAQEHFMGRKYPDEKAYDSLGKAWFKKVRSDTSWATAAADDHWSDMTLPTLNGWETAGLEGVDGAIWFQHDFDLPADWAGKDLDIDLGRIRDQDFTYVNGHLIGTAEGISTKRHYTIPAADLHPGRNHIAVQVLNYNDKGGFTGLKGNKPPFVLYSAGTAKPLQLDPVWKYRIQDQNPPQLPQYEAEYQPFGDLYLQIPTTHPQDYLRELELQKAISRVSYTDNGIHYTREYFASVPDKAIVIHLTADKPGAISFHAALKTIQRDYTVTRIDAHTMELGDKVKEGVLRGVAFLHIETKNGSNDGVDIKNADEALITLTAATSFVNYHDVSGNPEAICRARTAALLGRSWLSLREAHLHDYQPRFNTFSIRFGDTDSQLPTDQRILRYTAESDPDFIALYVQYARYLMLSSSCPEAAYPANLQGIWNNELSPPWGSKYTTNINLEMNYWPVEPLNLSSCSAPLFKLIENLSKAGEATAKDYYHARGWVLHHNTDLWCGTAPINASNHGIWPTGGAWLCHQVWEHYLFTKDKAFLQQYYPVMRSAADFFVDFLIPDPVHDWLISTPSASPEHGGLVAGPTMDHQIIRDLFRNCIAAARILGVDQAEAKTWQDKYNRIAPNQIGRYGQLQEWLEDKDDTTDTHRHISHLWGVYPGTDITWKDSTMMKAARQSLIYRGDGGTGWSLAWKVNCWARFLDGDHALQLVDKLLSNAVGAVGEHGGVYPNLFDAHPPFQIDGNFGGAAGIAEMLVQSQDSLIDILPALPTALPDGQVKGLCARGGFVLDLAWKNGLLQDIIVRSKTGGDCRLLYATHLITVHTTPGQRLHFDGQLKPLR